MSTIERPTTSEMSGKAYDLLDCFVSGLDRVVYEIAESLARAAGQVNPAGVVEIRQEDVRAAAEMVFAAIREKKDIPRDALDDIEEMHQCMQAKCKVGSPEA